MWAAGETLRQSGVAAVYLIHGTFAGDDALGVAAQIARWSPGLSGALREATKALIDGFAREVGNYTEKYATTLQEGLNARGESRPEIAVRRFCWSSENHHLGRAEGAIRFLDELALRAYPAGSRVVCWAHSHAGNLLALATNLLGGDRASVERFFAAARTHFRWPLVGRCDLAHWPRVEALLLDDRERSFPATLDIATYGTPIRYGWDSGGYGRLVHFVNHRPAADLPEYQTHFPPRLTSPRELLRGAEGDYVQHLGIVGTNIPPSLLSFRSWLADRRLGRLLDRDIAPRRLVERWRIGQRVPEEGVTLLVDYGPGEGPALEQLAGHGVYTKSQWMLFHAEESAKWMYEGESKDG